MGADRPLIEVAHELEISGDQLRYWLKLGGHEAPKRGRERYLTPATVEAMKETARLVALGVSPGEAVRQVGGVVAQAVPACREDVTGSSAGAVNLAPAADLQRAILMVAEGQKQQFDGLRQLIADLVETNQMQARRLESLAADVTESRAAVEASRVAADAAQQEAAQLRALVGSLAAAGVNQAREFAAIRTAISRPAHVVNLAKFSESSEPVKAWVPPKMKDPAREMGFLRRVWVEFTQPERLRRTPA